jgi:uncharacterized membrane protein
MFNALLILHFFGLSIGAGTSIYLLALARYATKNLEQAEARVLVPGIAGAISLVGNIGLVLLLGSGVSMIVMLGAGAMSAMFEVKMLLVALIVVFVATMNYLAHRVRHQQDNSAARLMQKLKFLGPLLGISTIMAAVLAFH